MVDSRNLLDQRGLGPAMDRFARGMVNPLTTLGISMLGNAADSVRPPGRAPLHGGQSALQALQMSANTAAANQMNRAAQPLLQHNLFERQAQRDVLQRLMAQHQDNPRVQLSVLRMLRGQ